jgi:hypothetical protein
MHGTASAQKRRTERLRRLTPLAQSHPLPSVANIPPLLPDETLERVLRHARANGTGVMMVASMFALLGAVGGEVAHVLAWLLVAGTGAMALHGATLIRHGESRGVNWLISGQVICMLFILSLCGWQLTHIDLAPLREAMSSEIQNSVKQTGLTEDQFLLISYRLTYAIIALATILYQGSMAVYYARRREAVKQELSQPVEESS